MDGMGGEPKTGDAAATVLGANVQLCPFCWTQVARPKNKRRKKLRCPWCKSYFWILNPDGTGNCAHCGVLIAVPRWIVGKEVLCPDCRGGLKLSWIDGYEA